MSPFPFKEQTKDTKPWWVETSVELMFLLSLGKVWGACSRVWWFFCSREGCWTEFCCWCCGLRSYWEPCQLGPRGGFCRPCCHILLPEIRPSEGWGSTAWGMGERKGGMHWLVTQLCVVRPEKRTDKQTSPSWTIDKIRPSPSLPNIYFSSSHCVAVLWPVKWVFIDFSMNTSNVNVFNKHWGKIHASVEIQDFNHFIFQAQKSWQPKLSPSKETALSVPVNCVVEMLSNYYAWTSKTLNYGFGEMFWMIIHRGLVALWIVN